MSDLSAHELERMRSQGVVLRPIGYVLSEREDPAQTPTRAAGNPDERGAVVVFDDYLEGLDGLEGFDFAWLVVFFDRTSESDDLSSFPIYCAGPASGRGCSPPARPHGPTGSA